MYQAFKNYDNCIREQNSYKTLNKTILSKFMKVINSFRDNIDFLFTLKFFEVKLLTFFSFYSN